MQNIISFLKRKSKHSSQHLSLFFLLVFATQANSVVDLNQLNQAQSNYETSKVESIKNNNSLIFNHFKNDVNFWVAVNRMIEVEDHYGDSIWSFITDEMVINELVRKYGEDSVNSLFQKELSTAKAWGIPPAEGLDSAIGAGMIPIRTPRSGEEFTEEEISKIKKYFIIQNKSTMVKDLYSYLKRIVSHLQGNVVLEEKPGFFEKRKDKVYTEYNQNYGGIKVILTTEKEVKILPLG